MAHTNRRYFAKKKTKFTEKQIAFALRQAETGKLVGAVCRKMGVSEARFYNWKKSMAGWASVMCMLCFLIIILHSP